MAQKYLDIAGLEYLWGKILDAIPTKVSELTNDSGYLTSANLPTKLSDLLNDQGFVTLDDVQEEIEKLVNGAPEALDTLKELADALGNDKNFASTITGLIGEKAKDSEVLHLAGEETITGNKDFTGDLKKSGILVATINDIGDGTLTVKHNGVQIGRFTANQSSDTEINIDALAVDEESGTIEVTNPIVNPGYSFHMEDPETLGQVPGLTIGTEIPDEIKPVRPGDIFGGISGEDPSAIISPGVDENNDPILGIGIGSGGDDPTFGGIVINPGSGNADSESTGSDPQIGFVGGQPGNTEPSVIIKPSDPKDGTVIVGNPSSETTENPTLGIGIIPGDENNPAKGVITVSPSEGAQGGSIGISQGDGTNPPTMSFETIDPVTGETTTEFAVKPGEGIQVGPNPEDTLKPDPENPGGNPSWGDSEIAFSSDIGDGKLTIQRNGSEVGTFTANQKDDSTVNIEVPTKVSELANDAGYLTEADLNGIKFGSEDGSEGGSGSGDGEGERSGQGGYIEIGPGDESENDNGSLKEGYGDGSEIPSDYVPEDETKPVPFEKIGSDDRHTTTVPGQSDYHNPSGNTRVGSSGSDPHFYGDSDGNFHAGTGNGWDNEGGSDGSWKWSNPENPGKGMSYDPSTGSLTVDGEELGKASDIKDGTLTIKSNGNVEGTFTANQEGDTEIDLKIPTKMSDLEQDIDFDTDEDGNAKVGAGLLILQENGTQKGSFSANSADDLTVNFLIPKKTSELENDAGFIKDVGSNPEAGSSGIHYDPASGSLQVGGKTAATLNDIGNATITLKKGDETIDSFTTNASTDKTIDLGEFADKDYVDQKVSDLVNSAPETLDTLKELADALGNDKDFANTMATELGKKANSSDIGDGTLTIKRNGSEVGTFTANQKTGTSVNIQVPTASTDLTDSSDLVRQNELGKGVLTIKKNGSAKGTFNANAMSDKEIDLDIPVRSSDLSDGDKLAFKSEIGDGTLTLKNGDSTLGTFTANQKGNSDIDLKSVLDGKADLQDDGSIDAPLKTYTEMGSCKVLLHCDIAGTDAFRIMACGENDNGYAEIATSDNADEPIYVRQYHFYTDSDGHGIAGSFGDIVNEVELLNKDGDTTTSGCFTANKGKDGSFHVEAKGTKCTSIQSLASDGSVGAFLDLCNKNDTNNDYKGGFRLSTSVSGKDLVGWTDGTLKWCGKNILTGDPSELNLTNVLHTVGDETADGKKTFLVPIDGTLSTHMPDLGLKELVRCMMDPGTDAFRIAVGMNSGDEGWAELAITDNGNEPIYVRRYSHVDENGDIPNGAGEFTRITSEIELLGHDDNSRFPGTIYVYGNKEVATKEELSGANTTITTIIENGYCDIIFAPVAEGLDDLEKLSNLTISSEEIVKNWERHSYYNNVWDGSSDDAKQCRDAYYYDSDSDSIVAPINQDTIGLFISNDNNSTNYSIKYSMTGLDTDDDSILVNVAWFMGSDGLPRTLNIVRNGEIQNQHDGMTFALVYGMRTTSGDSWPQSNESKSVVLAEVSCTKQSNGGTKLIEIVKTTSGITAKTTDNGSSDLKYVLNWTLPSSKPASWSNDMWSSIQHLMTQPCKIGVGTQSQTCKFKVLESTGTAFDNVIVYDVSDCKKKHIENGVVTLAEDFADVLKPKTFIYSEPTKKLWCFVKDKDVREIDTSGSIDWESASDKFVGKNDMQPLTVSEIDAICI